MGMLKRTKSIKTFAVTSIGLISAMVTAIPLFASCSGNTTLSIIQKSFQITSDGSTESKTYVAKGWNYKGKNALAFNANKLPKTINDGNKLRGGVDDSVGMGVKGTASISAEIRTSTETDFVFNIKENGHQTTAGNYTMYGYAFTPRQGNEYAALIDQQNPNGNTNAKAKVPGDPIEFKITVNKGL